MEQKITKILAREILDSRGFPTVETTVWAGEFWATAAVPSGASTGTHEALELRDGDKKRFNGKGVLKACKNVNSVIAPKLLGLNPEDQEQIDALMIELDGTKGKNNLGANAILSVSLAVCKLAAKIASMDTYEYIAKKYGYKPGKMPIPLFNVINGGVHADSGLEIQEFFIIPQKKKFAENLRIGAEVYHVLKKYLAGKKLSTSVGDEGGFAPHLGKNEIGFQTLEKAIKEAGYKLGTDFRLGIDAASSEFFDSKKAKYNIDKKQLSSSQMATMYSKWKAKYNLQIIEDGLAEDDIEGWKKLTSSIGKSTILVGDDLFVTNPERLSMGIREKIANAILIKVNQIGSLTETIDAIKMAQKNTYKVVISHRSGETNDDFIADLAAGVNADFAKMGSLSRGERLAKYNRLLDIETKVQK